MNFLIEHDWLIFLIGLVIHVSYVYWVSREFVKENPELNSGYIQAIRSIVLYTGGFLLIMAIGDVFNLTDSISDYFRPYEMNTIVLLWHVYTVSIWVRLIQWIFYEDGAKFIEMHPGLMEVRTLRGKRNANEKQAKIFIVVGILGGIISMVMMWCQFI